MKLIYRSLILLISSWFFLMLMSTTAIGNNCHRAASKSQALHKQHCTALLGDIQSEYNPAQYDKNNLE